MSLVIPPSFGLAAFVMTGPQGTQPYVTTCGVSLLAAEGDFVAAANSAFIAYSNAFRSDMTNQLTLDHVTLSVGQDGPGGSVDSTLAPVTGTVNTTFPPTALSAIIRKSTNNLGRSGRGRMFVPGILTEADVDQDGSLTTAARQETAVLANKFFTNLAQGVTADPLSFPLPPFLLHSEGVGIPPSPITGMVPSDLVGWIRGRIR